MSDSILKQLADANIADLRIDDTERGTGTTMTGECCDYYYTFDLTKAEMYQLAEEIKAEADKL